MTVDRNNRAGIWICDEWHPLPGNVQCVTFKDDPYWDFRRTQAPPGVERESYVYPRRARVEGRGLVTVGNDIELARQGAEAIILHTDGLRTARLTQQVLTNKGLSTHFIVDWDGTLYQCADPGSFVTLHAAEHNSRTVGIDLNNDLPDLLGRNRDQQDYRYPDGADKNKLHRRPRSEVLRINGSPKQSYGYCDPQYTALIELLKVLCNVLDIPQEPPSTSGVRSSWGCSKIPSPSRGSLRTGTRRRPAGIPDPVSTGSASIMRSAASTTASPS
jgi:hypothetical protein